MNRLILSPTLAAALVLATAPISFAAPDCGSATVVQEGETLSDVADRCSVTVDEISDANPDLAGGSTVAAGTAVALPGALGGWADRARGALQSTGSDLRNAAQQAGDKVRDLSDRASQEIQDAADRAGQSVSEYLDDHPELRDNLNEVGSRVGIPGAEAPLAVGADITVEPATVAPGDDVLISASGLPGGANVEVASGAPDGTLTPLETATTTASGTLDTRVRIPETAEDGSQIVYVIETNRLRLTSDPVTVEAQ